MVYEHYANGADHSYSVVETIVTALTHVITGVTGNYQIHVNMNHSVVNTSVPAGGIMPSFFLYVNGILQNTKVVVTLSETDGVHSRSASLSWRGPIATGQLVEVRTITIPESVVVLFDGDILINKEA